MLRSIRDLHGSTVSAVDGDIGSVSQAYFDDESWGVRYLVVETGNWLNDRQVLVSPYSVKHTDPGSSIVHVGLSRQQVRDSPMLDAHKPVSRQHEIEYLRYYSYPTYWGGPNLWEWAPTRPTTRQVCRQTPCSMSHQGQPWMRSNRNPTSICVAPTRSRATTSKQRMAVLVTYRISFTTTPTGRFATWSWKLTTGGPAAKPC